MTIILMAFDYLCGLTTKIKYNVLGSRERKEKSCRHIPVWFPKILTRLLLNIYGSKLGALFDPDKLTVEGTADKDALDILAGCTYSGFSGDGW